MNSNKPISTIDNSLCPCCTGKFYHSCCGIYIENQQKPSTPEALMRSRYTAYTQANMNYIKQTMKGPASMRFDTQRAFEWAKHVEWIKLEVIHCTTKFLTGHVEFIAHYKEQGKLNRLHEISEFHYENNEWFYVDGKHR